MKPGNVPQTKFSSTLLAEYSNDPDVREHNLLCAQFQPYLWGPGLLGKAYAAIENAWVTQSLEYEMITGLVVGMLTALSTTSENALLYFAPGIFAASCASYSLACGAYIDSVTIGENLLEHLEESYILNGISYPALRREWTKIYQSQKDELGTFYIHNAKLNFQSEVSKLGLSMSLKPESCTTLKEYSPNVHSSLVKICNTYLEKVAEIKSDLFWKKFIEANYQKGIISKMMPKVKLFLTSYPIDS